MGVVVAGFMLLSMLIEVRRRNASMGSPSWRCRSLGLDTASIRNAAAGDVFA